MYYCRIKVICSYAILVPPCRMEICVYYVTFKGVIMLRSPLVDQTCINRSEKFFIRFRPLFATPVCVWGKLRVGTWHNWEGTP